MPRRAAFDAAMAQIDAEEAASASSSPAPRPSLCAPKLPSVPPNILSSKPPGSASSAALLAHAQGAPSPMIASAREVELEGEVAALHGEIAKLESMLMSVKATVIEESEPEIVRLALSVAKRIVGREVTADPKILHRWIEEGTKALPNRGEITIVGSPDVADQLGDDAAHEITTDPMLPHGTCELREGEAMISVGLDAKMAAMSDALGVDDDNELS